MDNKKYNSIIKFDEFDKLKHEMRDIKTNELKHIIMREVIDNKLVHVIILMYNF
jgi:hypothetical protein